MTENIDYYAILGITRKAKADAIAVAYRKMAFRFHPDLHPGDVTCLERFKEITEAFEVLGDPIRRQQYDELGKRRDQADSFAESISQKAAAGATSKVNSAASFADLFGNSKTTRTGTTGFGGLFNTRKPST